MQRGERNTIVWTPDEHTLPMRSVQRGSRIGGAFMTLFSLAWCGVLYASIIGGTIKKGVNIPMTLFMLVFSLPGLVFLYAGLRSLFGRTEVTLGSDTVQVVRKGVGGSRRWVEPLRAFTGVLRRAIHHTSDDGPDYTEYQLLLAHSDPEKQVQLFNSRSSADWESAWHSFSGLLGLPLLDESELGVYQVGGGETPVYKASIPVGSDVVQVDARGIEVSRENGGYRFRFSQARTAWGGALGMAVSGGIAAVARMMQSQFPNDTLLVVFTWVMAGFVLICFGSLVRSLRSSEELTITGDRVEYLRGSGRSEGRRSVRMSLPTAEIRSVTVKSDPLHRGTLAAVTIEGADDSIRLATWRGFQVKLELMHSIAAALSEVTGKEAGAFQPDILMPGQRQIQRRSAALLVGAIAAFFVVMVPLMWLAFHDRPTEEAQRPAAKVADVKPPQDRSESSQSPEGAEKVRLELKSLHPQYERVATYSENSPLPLSRTPPAGLHNLPEDQGEFWYGELSLGAKPEHFPFALATGAPARLWLDRNRNGDLSDDGPPVQSSGTGVFAAEVQVTVAPIEKPLSLWLYTNDQLWKERQLTFYNRTQLVGRPIIGGREFLVVVAERGRHDGNFTNDGIYVDINRDGKIDPSREYVPPGGTVSLLGQPYRFEMR
jgi:hypothetical protein